MKLTKYQKHVAAANAEALALLAKLYPMNLPPAEQYLRDHRPSEGAIASLAWIAFDVLTRGAARQRAMMPRNSTLSEKIRKAGIERLADVKEKSPELRAGYTKRQLIDAISKVKRRK